MTALSIVRVRINVVAACCRISLGSLRQYATIYINLALASSVTYNTEAREIRNTIAAEDTRPIGICNAAFANAENLHTD